MSVNPAAGNPIRGPSPARRHATPGGGWRAAWPHLLFALLILFSQVTALLPGSVPESWGNVIAINALVVVVVGLLIGTVRAWRAGWRVGDASLYGYGLVVLVLASIVVVQIPPPPLRWQLMSWSLVSGAPLIGMLALLWMYRKAPLNAALMAVPLVLTFWLPTQEFTTQPARMLAYFGSFLMGALAAAWMVRLRRAEHAAVAGMLLSLAAGAAITYARAYYHTDYPGASSEIPLNVMLEYLFPQAAALSLFFCLPPVLNFLVGGSKGRWSTGGILAALGLLGQYLGYSLSFFWHMEMDTSWVFSPDMANPVGGFFTGAVYVSLGVYFVGLLLDDNFKGRTWWLAAVLLPTMLAIAAAALFYGMKWNPHALPLWMHWMPLVSPAMRMGISLVWMAFTAGVLLAVARKST